MKKSIKKRVLILVLIAYIFNCNLVFADNSSAIKEEIEKNKETIESLEKEKENINNQIGNEQKSLEDLEKDIELQTATLQTAQDKVMEFQVQIDAIQLEIDNIENLISESENEVKGYELIIEQLKNERVETEKVLSNRLRSFYKLDISKQYLYMIITSKNISELLNNIVYISKIISFDRDLINEIKQNQKETNENAEKVNANLLVQKENKSLILEKQNQLVKAQEEFIAIKEEENKQMNVLFAMQNQKESMIAELEGNASELASQITDLNSFNSELQEQLDQIFNDINNGSNNDDVIEELPVEGEYLRPVSGIITEYFGPRKNPVTGASGFHNGIDYGADYGTSIVATKSGVVEYAGWFGDFGNLVILNHGNGVQTLYAHAQSILVDKGQTISRGETIATVGSTGMSTGPHLHFEIRINGQPQDPYSLIPY